MTQSLVLGVGPAGASGSTERAASTSSTTVPCKRPRHGFVPTRARIPAIGRSVRVVEVGRTSSGAVGAVPTTDANKWVMSMDPQTLPASRRGSVLLAGHTWPDGSALGNAMLKNLHRGDRIVLAGKNHKVACYRVSERKSYPVNDVPSRSAFRSSGNERVVIVACSGKRLSPGHWSRRTLWYAVPVKPQAKPAPSSGGTQPPPSSTPSGGGLLGILGIL